MAILNLSYDDLASVICAASYIAFRDEELADAEVEAIVKSLTDQFNFEGRQDLLRSYLQDGSNMDINDAVRRIAAFGPAEKQWTSNFLVKTAVADQELTESEKEAYFKIQEICGLPDHNLDQEEEAAPEENKICGPETFEDLAAVLAVCIGTGEADGSFDQVELKGILDGLCAQYNFEGKDDLLFEYMQAASKMSTDEAIARIKRFGPGPKQFTSDMLFITILADGKATPEEKEVYRKMLQICDLPMFSGADKL